MLEIVIRLSNDIYRSRAKTKRFLDRIPYITLQCQKLLASEGNTSLEMRVKVRGMNVEANPTLLKGKLSGSSRSYVFRSSQGRRSAPGVLS